MNRLIYDYMILSIFLYFKIKMLIIRENRHEREADWLQLPSASDYPIDQKAISAIGFRACSHKNKTFFRR